MYYTFIITFITYYYKTIITYSYIIITSLLQLVLLHFSIIIHYYILIITYYHLSNRQNKESGITGLVTRKVAVTCFHSTWFHWSYLRTKFGCAQIQHQQAIVSQHQDLCSQLQCLEAEPWAFFDVNPCLIKKLSTKRVDPLVAFTAKRAMQLSPEIFITWKSCTGHASVG